MQHSYDLVFQSKTVGEAIALPPLVEALTSRGATLSAEGQGVWKPTRGEITFSLVKENGQLIGFDVRVPFHDSSELIELVAKAMLEISEAQNLRVMDPQRTDTVSLAGLGGLVDEYLRLARYAGEYGGVSEALGLSTYARPVDEESSSFKYLAALAVFVIALYAGWKTVTSVRQQRAQEEAPADGPIKAAPAQPVK
jgi:hypothetical protein